MDMESDPDSSEAPRGLRGSPCGWSCRRMWGGCEVLSCNCFWEGRWSLTPILLGSEHGARNLMRPTVSKQVLIRYAKYAGCAAALFFVVINSDTINVQCRLSPDCIYKNWYRIRVFDSIWQSVVLAVIFIGILHASGRLIDYLFDRR